MIIQRDPVHGGLDLNQPLIENGSIEWNQSGKRSKEKIKQTLVHRLTTTERMERKTWIKSHSNELDLIDL